MSAVIWHPAANQHSKPIPTFPIWLGRPGPTDVMGAAATQGFWFPVASRVTRFITFSFSGLAGQSGCLVLIEAIPKHFLFFSAIFTARYRLACMSSPGRSHEIGHLSHRLCVFSCGWDDRRKRPAYHYQFSLLVLVLSGGFWVRHTSRPLIFFPACNQQCNNPHLPPTRRSDPDPGYCMILLAWWAIKEGKKKKKCA